MIFFRGGGGGALVRHFSKKHAVDCRRISPKVPRVEATAISTSLYQIVKDHGPLSAANTWNHAKDANIDGLNSKTHMKIMLKWMMGRKMLKLSCTRVGSAKKFHYSILPEDPRASNADTCKSSVQEKKQTQQK